MLRSSQRGAARSWPRFWAFLRPRPVPRGLSWAPGLRLVVSKWTVWLSRFTQMGHEQLRLSTLLADGHWGTSAGPLGRDDGPGMMMMTTIQEIKRRPGAGWSVAAIVTALGIDPKPVRKYCAPTDFSPASPDAAVEA